MNTNVGSASKSRSKNRQRRVVALVLTVPAGWWSGYIHAAVVNLGRKAGFESMIIPVLRLSASIEGVR